MKQIILLCSILLLISCSKDKSIDKICDNYIITGERDGECIAYEMVDGIIVYNEDCQLYPRDSADIDLNRDGVIDFQIRSDAGCGLGAGSYRTYILSKNNTEISADTSDGIWVFPLDSSVNINSHPVYINEKAFLSINWWTLDYSPDEPYHEENNGYDWSIGKFVGVKIIAEKDTLYSWIKIEGNSRSVRLTEYAIR